jgi:succinate dehydrogenase / fumarate reductase cytochrome b subunit
MTGMALTIGLFLVTWGLLALANGRDSFEFFMAFCTSIFGQILLAGWTAAFFYHFCSGIRHLIRDFGYLYENKHSVVSGWLVIGLAFLMTAALWAYIYRDMITGGGA